MGSKLAHMSDPIVGQKEIAEQLRVAPNTVHQWGKRGLLPAPEGTVGGDPAWHLSTIEAWARQTGRVPGLREAILDLLLTVAGASTSPIAGAVISRGFGRSTVQVWRVLNDLFHEGLLGYRMPDHWFVTDMGRKVVDARRAGSAAPSKLWDDNAEIPAVYVPSFAAKPSRPIKSMRDLVGGVQAEAVQRRVQHAVQAKRQKS
jgi:hypothetical protein